MCYRQLYDKLVYTEGHPALDRCVCDATYLEMPKLMLMLMLVLL